MANNEEIISGYVDENEGFDVEAAQRYYENQQRESAKVSVEPAEKPAPRKAKSTVEQVKEKMNQNPKMPTEEITGIHYQSNLGYLAIDVATLPTQGMFYPEGTKIMIRAAMGKEIKHWSTMNDQDVNNMPEIDDIINYIIERCVNVNIPGIGIGGWKDLCEIDRLYLLMAVREYTFIDGENELLVPVSEGRDVPVTKEMVDFIKIPDKIMQYYSPEKRCFEFKLKNGKTFNMYIPSIGVNQWIKNYAYAKRAAREGYDADCLLYAPFLISNYRGLTQKTYEDMVTETSGWGTSEWSLISYVRDALISATRAQFKYNDENGAEVTVPLTFRGGIKALFTVQDPLSVLC